MKIAAVVILYHPERELQEIIKSYCSKVEKTYVVNNTENDNIYLNNISASVCYMQDGENKGIAARLNHVGKIAFSEGYEWLLTMDQDSSFAGKTIDCYFECAEKYAFKEETAMFGVNYYGEYIDKDFCNIEETRMLITSGSLVNLKLLLQLNGFEENLFIDEVDFEYCLKAASAGFKTVKFQNILLTHNLGEISYHRSLKNTHITPRTLHSPVRIYYMVRNLLFVRSKYMKMFPDDLKIKQRALLNRLKNNFLYNKQRITVIRYAIKGFADYRKNEFGKLKN